MKCEKIGFNYAFKSEGTEKKCTNSVDRCAYKWQQSPPSIQLIHINTNSSRRCKRYRKLVINVQSLHYIVLRCNNEIILNHLAWEEAKLIIAAHPQSTGWVINTIRNWKCTLISKLRNTRSQITGSEHQQVIYAKYEVDYVNVYKTSPYMHGFINYVD